MIKRLGDAPIEPKYREQMNAIAQALDQSLNGSDRGADREVGFVLLVFDYGETEGRCIISNGADRTDIVTLFREMIARFEGQPRDVERLRLLNAELVNTLEWYADKGNYETGQDWPDILIDNGAGARAAIAKARGEA